MPTDSLMPKRKSGGTGYVIAAVVMFAIMGGLIYWKVSQGAEEADEPEVAQPVPTEEEEPILQAPPPPPPPEEELEEEEEGEEPTKEASTKKGSTGAGAYGCGVRVCEGNAGADLRSAVSAKAGQARSCYQHALRNDSSLAGKMRVAVRVGTNGMACSAAITSDTLNNPQVKNCVTRLFRAGTYPRPKGGCVDMAVGVNFTSK